ncbi:MAG: hypothetical protein HS108_13770 [Planctomycetes bacterium]|nr:hypothetical protein [Planctomycetota bacterium]MCL4730894.1 hypothetical protein [Planctomycetota bacterium]
MRQLWHILTALVLITGMSPALLAQCSGGGGCGTGGCGTSSGGCPTGGCPSGGCPSAGGGGGVPAPKKVNGVAPIPQPVRAGGGAAAPAVDPAKVPKWAPVSGATLENAAKEQLPIVVYFPAENEADTTFYGEDLAKLSKEKALFVKIPYNPDREKSLFDDSVVPTSKLLSDNPSRDYKIAVGKATLLVCDWHGNEYHRFQGGIKAPELGKVLDKVKDKAEDSNKKLQKNLDSATAAWTKQDRKAALAAILKNFKEDVVGLDAQEGTIRLYHEIMDAAKAQISDMTGKGDKDGLKNLAKELKGTDAGKAANEALKKLG